MNHASVEKLSQEKYLLRYGLSFKGTDVAHWFAQFYLTHSPLSSSGLPIAAASAQCHIIAIMACMYILVL